MLNPFRPTSDQNQISPRNINWFNIVIVFNGITKRSLLMINTGQSDLESLISVIGGGVPW